MKNQIKIAFRNLDKSAFTFEKHPDVKRVLNK